MRTKRGGVRVGGWGLPDGEGPETEEVPRDGVLEVSSVGQGKKRTELE